MVVEYDEQVLTHFSEPRNLGIVEDADGIGQLGDADCGDVFFMFVKVADNHLANVKYLVRGCGAAIATCSALSEIARGRSVESAMRLSDEDIADALGRLPLAKLHCSNLAATVLHRALEGYEARRRRGLPPHHVELQLDDERDGGQGEQQP